LVPVLFTFYIEGVLKLKKISLAPKGLGTFRNFILSNFNPVFCGNKTPNSCRSSKVKPHICQRQVINPVAERRIA
jgi:hypothetical protein